MCIPDVKGYHKRLSLRTCTGVLLAVGLAVDLADEGASPQRAMTLCRTEQSGFHFVVTSLQRQRKSTSRRFVRPGASSHCAGAAAACCCAMRSRRRARAASRFAAILASCSGVRLGCGCGCGCGCASIALSRSSVGRKQRHQKLLEGPVQPDRLLCRQGCRLTRDHPVVIRRRVVQFQEGGRGAVCGIGRSA